MSEKFGEFTPKSPEIEQAEKVSACLENLFAGKEPSGRFESYLFWEMEKVFVEPSPADPGTPKETMQRNAHHEVLSVIEKAGNKPELSAAEQEIMEKLGKYFTGAIKRTGWIENGREAIGFLEHIPSKESVSALEKLSRAPLSVIEPKEKSISRMNPFLKTLSRGISPEEAIRNYIEQIIKPEALRSLIILKNKMGLNLTPEEKEYFEKHTEKF